MKIYTKSGDKGKTSLGHGQRVLKTSVIIAAIGTIDELNASLGLAITDIEDVDMEKNLHHIQHKLFDMGADLALSEDKRIAQEHIIHLERLIDFYFEQVDKINAFVLPGGTRASSHLHLARTICRRAERDVACLMQEHTINEHVFVYLNRLSDLLFIMARYMNKGKDVIWQVEHSK